MAGPTDPNKPNGPNGDAAGGFYDPNGVAGIGGGLGSPQGYDPSGVQEMIDTFMASHKGHQTAFQTQYLMWLMQEYGNQKIGVGANTQNQMNKYFGDVKKAWNALYSAEAGKSTDMKSETDFLNALHDIRAQISGDPTAHPPIPADPYFAAHPDMAKQIIGTLNSVEDILTSDPDSKPGENKLWYMWQQYNGKAGPASATQGDSSHMDQLMRNLGETNQQFTGVSQSVGTVLKSDTKNQQASMDALNNFLKMLQKITQQFVSATKATS